MSLPKLEFFYDIVSPYSYIAAARLDRFDGLAEVVWRPFLLGGVFKAAGNSAPLHVPAKGMHMPTDLRRLTAHYGLPYAFPSVFPTNTVTVQRVLCAASDAERPALSLKLYDAYWGHGRDVGDPALLTEIAGAALVARAGEDEAKNRLRANTEEAVARGAFGAPTFFFGDDLYFGEDRLFLIEARLKG